MKRIDSVFAALRGKRRSALIPYVVAGDPAPSLTVPLGMMVLPVPTCLSANAWTKPAESPLPRLPVVIDGIAVELVEPSYAFVSVEAVTVIARAVTVPVASLAKLTT